MFNFPYVPPIYSFFILFKTTELINEVSEIRKPKHKVGARATTRATLGDYGANLNVQFSLGKSLIIKIGGGEIHNWS